MHTIKMTSNTKSSSSAAMRAPASSSISSSGAFPVPNDIGSGGCRSVGDTLVPGIGLRDHNNSRSKSHRNKLHISLRSVTHRSLRRLRSRKHNRNSRDSSSVQGTSSATSGGNNSNSNVAMSASQRTSSSFDTASDIGDFVIGGSGGKDDVRSNSGGAGGDVASCSSSKEGGGGTGGASFGSYNGGAYNIIRTMSNSSLNSAGTAPSFISCPSVISSQSHSDYNKLLSLNAIERESTLLLYNNINGAASINGDDRSVGSRSVRSSKLYSHYSRPPSSFSGSNIIAPSPFQLDSEHSNPTNNYANDDDSVSVRTTRTIDWDSIENDHVPGASEGRDEVLVDVGRAESKLPSPRDNGNVIRDKARISTDEDQESVGLARGSIDNNDTSTVSSDKSKRRSFLANEGGMGRSGDVMHAMRRGSSQLSIRSGFSSSRSICSSFDRRIMRQTSIEEQQEESEREFEHDKNNKPVHPLQERIVKSSSPSATAVPPTPALTAASPLKRIFVLLIAPTTRQFELIPIDCSLESTTVKDVLQKRLAQQATEKSLKRQKYVNLCRASISVADCIKDEIRGSDGKGCSKIAKRAGSSSRKVKMSKSTQLSYNELVLTSTLSENKVKQNDIFVAVPDLFEDNVEHNSFLLNSTSAMTRTMKDQRHPTTSTNGTLATLSSHGSSSKNCLTGGADSLSTVARAAAPDTSTNDAAVPNRRKTWSSHDCVKMGNVILSNPRVKKLIRYATKSPISSAASPSSSLPQDSSVLHDITPGGVVQGGDNCADAVSSPLRVKRKKTPPAPPPPTYPPPQSLQGEETYGHGRSVNSPIRTKSEKDPPPPPLPNCSPPSSPHRNIERSRSTSSTIIGTSPPKVTKPITAATTQIVPGKDFTDVSSTCPKPAAARKKWQDADKLLSSKKLASLKNEKAIIVSCIDNIETDNDFMANQTIENENKNSQHRHQSRKKRHRRRTLIFSIVGSFLVSGAVVSLFLKAGVGSYIRRSRQNYRVSQLVPSWIVGQPRQIRSKVCGRGGEVGGFFSGFLDSWKGTTVNCEHLNAKNNKDLSITTSKTDGDEPRYIDRGNKKSGKESGVGVRSAFQSILQSLVPQDHYGTDLTY